MEDDGERGEEGGEVGENGRVWWAEVRLLRLADAKEVMRGLDMAEHRRSISRKVRRGE